MTSEQPLRAEGFNQAIIGNEYNTNRVVYSIERMLQILIDRDGMSMEEAIEYFSFNIGGAYVGEMTPMYVWTEDKVEL
jgi:hypothetical protein